MFASLGVGKSHRRGADRVELERAGAVEGFPLSLNQYRRARERGQFRERIDSVLV
jgi:hypothetical protein